MKIEQLELPGPLKRWKTQRCAKSVSSYGTHYFSGEKDKCARMARFKMNGVLLCKQHAGDAALEYLFNQQNQK